MAGAFDAKVDISTKEATAGLSALRKEVKLTGESLQQLDGIIKANKQNVILIAQQFTKLVAEQRKAAAATKETAQADIAAARAAGIRATADAKVAETLARKANQEAQAGRATAQAGVASARITDIEARRGMAADKVAAATRRAAASQLELHDSLSNSRYLMYDVGATYGVLAAGLMALPAATAAVAAAYQKDFAQVIRVTEDLGKQEGAHQALKDSLKSLANDMPVGFDELSRITQLGAQMGVLDTKLVGFTETTAKFVAVTGISADAGAQLFGRLETSFTNDVQKFPDFFERVGSSIAYVGAKTVATDPEIASMLNQIGPLGAAAGMTASEVTGLAAALASVRVQPELARGTLTRVFGQLNRDVAEGSPRMAEYGKILGMTGEQASALWKTDSSKFFTDLMAGLQGVQQNQGQLTTTLDKLGITASRDVSALTKLAVGYDVLELSMKAADKGFTEGTALSTMSKPIFETVIAKLTEFANAWKNLGDTIGAGGLAPLGVLVDMAKNLAIGLESLVKQVPLVGTLLQVLMGIAAVTAVFLGFKAAQAFVMAGMIGFQQASARGMATGMGLSSITKTLAQTMLMAKGATDAQSRALLAQANASGALMIATMTTSAQIRSGAAGSFGVLATATGRATGGIKGAGSALLGMVGGPIGIAVGALALLAGGFITTAVEAEQAGKSIAEAMQQGADAGRRAVAESLGNRKVQLSITEGDISFHKLNQSVTEVARNVGVSFDDIVDAVSGGTESAKTFQKKMDELKAGAGLDKFKADAYGWLGRVAVEMAESTKSQTANLKDIEQAAPKAGAALAAMGDGAEDGTSPIEELTKALKALNDEVFGTINAESALQESLARIGEGLQKSQSYSPTSEGGRANIQNFQDTLTKARDYYEQLRATEVLSAQEAAQGYADFTASLLAEIRGSFGGDTSYVEELAAHTREKFTAAIGGGVPVEIPVEVRTEQVMTGAVNAWTMIQNWYNANEAQARVGVDSSNADLQLSNLAQSLMEITGLPYDVVLDALTDPASEKSVELQALILEITNGTYTAAIGADTSAAITNVQNFVAYARTELAHLQTAMNGGIGLADGEGSMSPAQKAQYGAISTTQQVAAPSRAPAQVKPSTKIPVPLRGVADGYNKAADAANKAGKAGKQAGKDIADGIDDAVKAAEDFGNRLKTALMSAYNQQYGLATATDQYHSALNSITKKREDEIKQVSDLRDKVRELNNERDKELISANKAKIEQGISVKYGETGRAADYGQQAQEALDNAAAKQKDIDATQKQATEIQNGIGLLTGFSDAAIANRAALRDLEVKMIDMVAAYAAQGHSSEEVRRYAQGLTAQFQTDVGQIGFNMAAVQGLTGDMGRYIDTINRVPQFVATDVSANTEGAAQEMAAYGEAADMATVPRTQYLGLSISEEFEAFLAKKGKWATLADINGDTFRPSAPINGGFRGGNVGSILGMASGGMVPGTPPANRRADNKLAQVDGKGFIKIRSREFIQPQEAVDYYGADAMEMIRTLRMPKFNMGGSTGGHSTSAGNGSGYSVVALDAETLNFLASLKQDIKLYADSKELASTVNAGNRQLAAEGHR